MVTDWIDTLTKARRVSIASLGICVLAGMMPAQTEIQITPLAAVSDAAASQATPSQTAAPQVASSQSTSSQPTLPARDEYKPLTQEERFHHYIHGMFSFEAVLRSAAGAAILQETNTPAEWGQGAEGYGRRFANSYAQHMMRQTLEYGLSDALDEDNRYIPSGRTGAGPRLLYAIESSFLARRHDGRRRISISRLGSYAAVAAISREWQPHSTADINSGFLSFGTTMGSEIGFNVAREFLPSIFRRH